jgi:hypothetical protein
VPELLPPPVRDVPIRDVPNTASKTAINRYLVLNKLIEFRHNDDYILGLIVKEGSAESRLSVVSADGTVYGVGQRQVTIVLPGRHHSLQYLKSIQDKVCCRPFARCCLCCCGLLLGSCLCLQGHSIYVHIWADFIRNRAWHASPDPLQIISPTIMLDLE